ncbi:hypothetical protein JXA32_16855, partial [Candidatus Sumerlaeota bacterium]|nr:hypothetical protein [Candidatus Sumerlaeota bacterium]
MVLLSLGVFALMLLGSRQAQAQRQVEEIYFVPATTDEVHNAFDVISDDAIGTTIRNVISIALSETNTIVIYDHWEDGYEADIEHPTQLTGDAATQIWGDGDLSNGYLAEYPTDVFSAGDIISLISNVEVPRDSDDVYYDSRDKFYVSTLAAPTFYLWPTNPGAVLAGAMEIYSVNEYGMEFIAPVGKDTSNDESMFEYAVLSIMASEDDTLVQVDTDADGDYDITETIDAGETVFTTQSNASTGGINEGAHVLADKPVQAHLITGDVNSSWECRFFTLFPTERWSNRYYNPVYSHYYNPPGPGNTQTNYADVFIYNPNASTVRVYTYDGTGGETDNYVDVGAGTTARYQMPFTARGVRFTSQDGSPFFAIMTMDRGSTSYDWGASLIPDNELTPVILVGWGDGAEDTDNDGTPDANGNPVWIMSLSATTLYVDYDGDPDTGAYTDSLGNHVDEVITLSDYGVTKVFDNSDNSQTGLRAYTLNGANIVAAWGQDRANAQAGSPYLDVGTAVLPLPLLLGTKDFTLADDANGDGMPSPGDTIQFIVHIRNEAGILLGDINVLDELEPYLIYVEDSTTLNGAPVADDTLPTSTPFPLDEAGYDITPLPYEYATSMTFLTVIQDPLPAGVDYLENEVYIESVFGSADFEVNTEISDVAAVPDLAITNVIDTDPVVPGGTIDYVIDYANLGDQDATGVVITMVIPANTSFNTAGSDPAWVCTPDEYEGSTCTLTIGDLAGEGAGSSVTLSLYVDTPFFPSNSPILNSFYIEDDGTNGVDSDLTNNTFNTSTDVDTDTTITAVKTDAITSGGANGLVGPGDVIEYTITLTNVGSIDAGSVVFTDTPDAATELLAGSV